MGMIEIEIPQSEGKENPSGRSMGFGKNEYFEWKEKSEFKRWEKNQIKKVERVMKNNGALEEEDFFVGAITVGGWNEGKSFCQEEGKEVETINKLRSEKEKEKRKEEDFSSEVITFDTSGVGKSLRKEEDKKERESEEWAAQGVELEKSGMEATTEAMVFAT